MRGVMLMLALFGAADAVAQESRLHADLRNEGRDINESCGGGFDAKQVIGCVITVATDDPLHVAVGSLAPQNGMGFGAAFVEHWTPNERWRIGWSADGVIAPNGSYRAGFYMKFMQTPTSTTGGIVVRRPSDTEPPRSPASVTIREYPIFNVYAQTMSLDTIPIEAGGDQFRERQTIVGTNVIYPLTRWQALQPLRLAAVGSVNGRFVTTGSGVAELNQTGSFAEFEEGIRFKPLLANDRVQLNYLATLQQFVTPTTSVSSFHRWSIDLKHDVFLYRTVSSTGPKDANTPNECAQAPGAPCAPVSYSRNREGSISFRLVASKSVAGSDASVPFYFQPTLGGSDINGQRLLSAYDDYQFRGDNLLVFQEGVEHSVWGPIGVYVLVEQGTVTAEGTGLTAGDFSNSFGVGLTIRAGGFPLINVSFAWGGGGHHLIGTIDPSLLGGSNRPSLY